MLQHTIKKEVSISGIGIHTGEEVSIRIKPAGANSGITFIRADQKGKPRIKAELNNVTSTIRGTNLGGIFTVEHLLSALYSMSVNNAEIEIMGSEPPVLDGSSLCFCRIIEKAGVLPQKSKIKTVKLRKPIIKMDNDKCIVALPHDRLTISFMINYPFDFIGSQFYRLDMGVKNYVNEIAPARTYGFLSEVSDLKKRGLARGASGENAIVIGEDRYLTKLRFRDELVRHKILDLIGDLSLLGAEIKAHIICIRSGHDLNIKFANLLKEVG